MTLVENIPYLFDYIHERLTHLSQRTGNKERDNKMSLGAAHALQKQLRGMFTWDVVHLNSWHKKDISKSPIPGFKVYLKNDEDIFEWQVGIMGPPATLYQGGYFLVR
jgi:hypothetical protein